MDFLNHFRGGWKTMKKIACVLIIVLAFCLPAHAGDIVLEPTLLQSEFDKMSKELGFGISYFPMAPAAPLGILGFNAGIEVTMLDIKQDSTYWDQVTTKTPPDYFPIPRLHIQKGLPFKLDIGAIFTQVPDSNIKLFGGELKWAVLEGSMITPAFALRGAYTKLNGVDTLDMDTMSLDASISKGFVMITPYAGVGQIWINAEEKVPVLALEKAKEELTKIYGGLKFDPFPLVSLTAEVDYADIMAYSLRLSVNF